MLANDYEKIIKDNTDEEYGELKSSVKTIDKAVETLNINIYRFECLYDTLEKHGYTPSMNDLLNSNKELEKSLGIELPTTNELIRMSEEQNKEVSIVLKAGLENFLKDIWDFIANIFKAIWNAIVRFFKFIFRIKDSSSSESAKEEAKSNMEKNKEAVDKASDQTVSNLKSVIEEVKDLNAFEKVLNGDGENVTDEMKEKVQKAKDDLDRLLSDKDSPLVFGEKLEKEVVAETKITEMKLFDLSKRSIVTNISYNISAMALRNEWDQIIDKSVEILKKIKTGINEDPFEFVKEDTEMIMELKKKLVSGQEVAGLRKILNDNGTKSDESDDPMSFIRGMNKMYFVYQTQYEKVEEITNKRIGKYSLDTIYENFMGFEFNTKHLIPLESKLKGLQNKIKEANGIYSDIQRIVEAKIDHESYYKKIPKVAVKFIKILRDYSIVINLAIEVYQNLHRIQRQYAAAIKIATGKGKKYIEQIDKILQSIYFPPIPASSEVYEEYKEMAAKVKAIRNEMKNKNKSDR